MTNLGPADRIYVCGPDCKALPTADAVPVAEGEHEDINSPWWHMALAIVLGTVIVVFATVGALDVGVRAALNYWSF